MEQRWGSPKWGRDGREPDDDGLAKCRSPQGDLVQPRGGEDGGARGELRDAQRRGKTQRRGHEELAKLTAAMATALSPGGVTRERQGESGRALSECGVSWRPWRRRRPDERGQCRHTGAKWRTGVALGVHDGELGSESDHAITDWQSYFDDDYLPNQGELGDGVVDKVGVQAEFYKIVN